MNTSQTFFSDLPRHEKVRAIGQATVQIGLFFIAVSSVLKQLGNLPETPVGPTTFTEPSTERASPRGYFD